LSESSAAEYLGGRFDLVKSAPVTDSVPIFAGTEKWQEWQLRPNKLLINGAAMLTFTSGFEKNLLQIQQRKEEQ
jgi:hypothetical protein